MDSDEEETEELSDVEEGEASGAEEEGEELSGTEEAEEPSEEGLAAGFPPQAARLNISTAARRRAKVFFIGLSDPFLQLIFGGPAEQLLYAAGLLRCLPRDSLIHYTACSGGGQDGGRRVGPAP